VRSRNRSRRGRRRLGGAVAEGRASLDRCRSEGPAVGALQDRSAQRRRKPHPDRRCGGRPRHSADQAQDREEGHLAIVVSNQVAYEQGDVVGLEAIAGLTKTQASTYAGQWISIPKGDKDYGGAAADVTLGSVIQFMTPHGRLAVVARRLHGTRVIAVVGLSGKGKKKELQVLAARRGKNRLPVEEDETAPGLEYIAHTVFSRWNESVQVQVPSSSVPIATVRG
jgi:hypothetical protein